MRLLSATTAPRRLCAEHALILSDPVTAQYPVCKTVTLPLRARLFLCSTCREAMRQTIDDYRAEFGRLIRNAATRAWGLDVHAGAMISLIVEWL